MDVAEAELVMVAIAAEVQLVVGASPLAAAVAVAVASVVGAGVAAAVAAAAVAAAAVSRLHQLNAALSSLSPL
jgi:hypothetical protein